MIYIYSDFFSNRLLYVCDYIFTHRFHTEYTLIHSKEEFRQLQDGIRINYSTEKELSADIYIHAHSFLSEQSIAYPSFHTHRWKKTVIPFYNQPGASIPFDLFSAVFFYLSRIEEYTIREKDRHGRFPYELSFSSQYKTVHQPVVDIWLKHFKLQLEALGANNLHQDEYELKLSFDIDLLYKYLHKPFFKKVGGILKDIFSFHLRSVRERFQVYNGKKEDPYFCFDKIHSIISHHAISVQYFLLMRSDTAYDKMHPLTEKIHQQVIQQLHQDYLIALHPSYYSIEEKRLVEEKNLLETIIGEPIHQSRQHYIKLDLPKTYRVLIENGIRDDYSMGYPQHNGFRAGTSRPFYWFDVERDEVTSLFVHPFSWMDATTLFYLKKKELKEIEMEWVKIQNEVIQTDGILLPIFHNYILGDTILNPSYFLFFQKLYSKKNESLT